MTTPPMSDAQAAKLLNELEVLYRDPVLKRQQRRNLLSKMINLAHAQYRPALDFFRSGLDDPDWSWRLDHLSQLGYHYEIEQESEIAAKIRELLARDPSAEVRMAAASVMAQFSTWPDATLLRALAFDEDVDVKQTAFEVLLMLLGIPMQSLSRVRGTLANEGLAPSIATLRQIAESVGKVLSEDMYMK
jgi:hypothetical protein